MLGLALAATARWLATTRSAAAVPWWRRAGALLGRRLRSLRPFRPPPPMPIGPPIERIAADLRRLQAWLDVYSDSRPLPGKATRLAAVAMAYDRVLCDACRALEIEHDLDDTTGFEREAERVRVQVTLADAGLALTRRHRTGR